MSKSSIELAIKDFSKGLNLDDAENVCDLSYNVNCYNFDFKSGALVEGVGIERLTLPKTREYGSSEAKIKDIASDVEVKNVWHFKHYTSSAKKREDKLMYRLSDNTVYTTELITSLPIPLQINDLLLNDDVTAINFKDDNMDTILMCTDEDGCYTYSAESPFEKHENMPIIKDLCVHKDKVFVLESFDKTNIRYSNNLNILEMKKELSDGEGKISLTDNIGEVQKLISQYGHLFAVRDYGITKITTYANSDNFNISNIYASGTKIYEKTVCSCGDTIIMLTRNGLYEFNANSCEKINTKLNDFLNKINNDKAIACFRAGNYYISCRIDFKDGKKIGCENEDNYVNNVFICYNVIDKTYSICRGIDITNLLSLQIESCDKVIATFGSKYQKTLGQVCDSGSFFDEINERYWCSPLSDLGYSDKTKYVKYLSLLSNYDCNVTVFTEKLSKTFKVRGKSVLTKLPVNIRGKQIGIKITTNEAKAYISNLKLSIDLTDNLYD